METELTVPQGTFVLERHDRSRDRTVRAWDAADEYLLVEIAERGLGGRTLVVEDAFGALAVGLGADVAWVDSVVSVAAITANRAANDQPSIDVVASSDAPTGPFDLVVVKVPRVTAYLDDLLARLRPVLTPSTAVIGAGMTKAVHRSTIEVFERHLGPTPTSRARKKARLLQPVGDWPAPAARPDVNTFGVEGVVVSSLPNVFSSATLDRATELLLDVVATPPVNARVIDLGCGNGVVGAVLHRREPSIDLCCLDSSFQAVASARLTLDDIAADIRAADGLDDEPDASADLVVVNPPFHAGGTRTSDVAMRMIHDSWRVLAPGGRLAVVGNRHLGYHAPIRRRFGNGTIETDDPQFVVITATR